MSVRKIQKQLFEIGGCFGSYIVEISCKGEATNGNGKKDDTV